MIWRFFVVLLLICIGCNSSNEMEPIHVYNCQQGWYDPSSSQKEAFEPIKDSVTTLRIKDAGDYCDVYLVLKEPIPETGNKDEYKWLHCYKFSMWRYENTSNQLMKAMEEACDVNKLVQT